MAAFWVCGKTCEEGETWCDIVQPDETLEMFFWHHGGESRTLYVHVLNLAKDFINVHRFDYAEFVHELYIPHGSIAHVSMGADAPSLTPTEIKSRVSVKNLVSTLKEICVE